MPRRAAPSPLSLLLSVRLGVVKSTTVPTQRKKNLPRDCTADAPPADKLVCVTFGYMIYEVTLLHSHLKQSALEVFSAPVPLAMELRSAKGAVAVKGGEAEVRVEQKKQGVSGIKKKSGLPPVKRSFFGPAHTNTARFFFSTALCRCTIAQ